jgi:UDP-N-acetylglucosamine--N-acetylmuramyl-(pentapeptide) pyrophosphoryl-undecaprenol N-acetylglucosamine transferase
MQAIAEQLEQRGVASTKLHFVGSRRGQEETLLGALAIDLTLLPGRGIRRSFAPKALLDNFGAIAGLVGAAAVAFVKVGRWRPSVAVSVGGYASFAVALAAVLWRRPLVLVELDATPGAAHRLLGRFASVRCTSFPSNEARTVFTGAPLRDAVVAVDRSPSSRERARAACTPPIEPGRQVVVVMTGSLGAKSVNRAVSDLARLWASRSDRTLIHVTGRRDFDEITNDAPELSGLDYRVVAFGDMIELWSVCDAAVCRAGATTVAELTALGICSVLVPLPGAPGDHQTKNARVVADAGGARLVPDGQCDAATLARILDDVMEPDTLASMSEAVRSLGHRDASSEIARVVCEVGGWS